MIEVDARLEPVSSPPVCQPCHEERYEVSCGQSEAGHV